MGDIFNINLVKDRRRSLKHDEAANIFVTLQEGSEEAGVTEHDCRFAA